MRRVSTLASLDMPVTALALDVGSPPRTLQNGGRQVIRGPPAPLRGPPRHRGIRARAAHGGSYAAGLGSPAFGDLSVGGATSSAQSPHGLPGPRSAVASAEFYDHLGVAGGADGSATRGIFEDNRFGSPSQAASPRRLDRPVSTPFKKNPREAQFAPPAMELTVRSRKTMQVSASDTHLTQKAPGAAARGIASSTSLPRLANTGLSGWEDRSGGKRPQSLPSGPTRLNVVAGTINGFPPPNVNEPYLDVLEEQRRDGAIRNDELGAARVASATQDYLNWYRKVEQVAPKVQLEGMPEKGGKRPWAAEKQSALEQLQNAHGNRADKLQERVELYAHLEERSPPQGLQALAEALAFELETMEDAFAYLDFNGNGEISLLEFTGGMSILGLDLKVICGMDEARVFRKLDLAKDGVVRLDEIMQLTAPRGPGQYVKRLAAQEAARAARKQRKKEREAAHRLRVRNTNTKAEAKVDHRIGADYEERDRGGNVHIVNEGMGRASGRSVVNTGRGQSRGAGPRGQVTYESHAVPDYSNVNSSAYGQGGYGGAQWSEAGTAGGGKVGRSGHGAGGTPDRRVKGARPGSGGNSEADGAGFAAAAAAAGWSAGSVSVGTTDEESGAAVTGRGGIDVALEAGAAGADGAGAALGGDETGAVGGAAAANSGSASGSNGGATDSGAIGVTDAGATDGATAAPDGSGVAGGTGGVGCVGDGGASGGPGSDSVGGGENGSVAADGPTASPGGGSVYGSSSPHRIATGSPQSYEETFHMRRHYRVVDNKGHAMVYNPDGTPVVGPGVPMPRSGSASAVQGHHVDSESSSDDEDEESPEVEAAKAKWIAVSKWMAAGIQRQAALSEERRRLGWMPVNEGVGAEGFPQPQSSPTKSASSGANGISFSGEHAEPQNVQDPASPGSMHPSDAGSPGGFVLGTVSDGCPKTPTRAAQPPPGVRRSPGSLDDGADWDVGDWPASPGPLAASLAADARAGGFVGRRGGRMRRTGTNPSAIASSASESLREKERAVKAAFNMAASVRMSDGTRLMNRPDLHRFFRDLALVDAKRKRTADPDVLDNLYDEQMQIQVDFTRVGTGLTFWSFKVLLNNVMKELGDGWMGLVNKKMAQYTAVDESVVKEGFGQYSHEAPNRHLVNKKAEIAAPSALQLVQRERKEAEKAQFQWTKY